MADTHALTKRQIRCLEKLPEDHEVVSNGDSPPVVRGPKGQLLRVKHNGHLEALVERVRSYLYVNG
jgi:hypothetical protein